MKVILLFLFYQAIVAVNTAVILSNIIWLAKRKDEKDGRKPNPDFTPPPEKKQPKPPTTWTNVIEPKPHGYHLTMTTYDAKDYGKTHTFNGEEYERTMAAQSGDGSVVSMIYIRKHPQPKPYPHDIEALKASLDEWKREPPMHIPTEGAKEHKRDKFSCFYAPFSNLTREQVLDGLDRYIKDFHPNDLLDRVENEIRKRIKDDQRTGTQPIQSFIGEVRGGPGNEVMGTVAAKSAEELEEKLKALSDTLDRTGKKPVTPERLKEAGFEAEPVNVFNPAEEGVKRYEARTAQLPHYCGNCIAHRQEKFDGEIIHVCMRHKVWLHNQERWDGGCDAWEPSPAICKLYKEWADGFCASCEYFEPDEPGQKRGMGLCARNDEIKMMGQSCAGYTRKGELPKYLERQPMETPEPLGTVTTH